MWIIGLFGFFLIYRIEFRWYLVSMIKMGNRPSSVPMILLKPFFHYIIHGFAFFIFCFSTYCFYTLNPWMVLLSLGLLPILMIVHERRQSQRVAQIISLAASIQTSMERGGASRVQINDAICIAALGGGYGLGSDMDLKELVKYFILPNLGLLASTSSILKHSGSDSTAFEQHQKECAEIDITIERLVAKV